MSDPARAPMTVEQFLAWDDGTDTRHELVSGAVVAMSPPAAAHGVIAANCIMLLGRKLPLGCRVLAEAGAQVDETTWFQADVAVVCGAIERGQRHVAPDLGVEVLSPSTRAADRGAKLDAYKGLPSVREIWLVESERRWLQLWVRGEGAWIVTDHVGGAAFTSPFLATSVTLDEVYEGLPR